MYVIVWITQKISDSSVHVLWSIERFVPSISGCQARLLYSWEVKETNDLIQSKDATDHKHC